MKFKVDDLVRVATQPENQQFVRLVGEVGYLSEVNEGMGMLETFKSSSSPCGGSGWVTLSSLVPEDRPEYVAMKAARDEEQAKFLRESEARGALITATKRALAEKYGISVDAVHDIHQTLQYVYEP